MTTSPAACSAPAGPRLRKDVERDRLRLGLRGPGFRPVHFDLLAGPGRVRRLDDAAVDPNVALLDQPLNGAARDSRELAAEVSSSRSDGSECSTVRTSEREDISRSQSHAVSHPSMVALTWTATARTGLGLWSLRQVMKKTNPTPVQMALSATLKAETRFPFRPAAGRRSRGNQSHARPTNGQ